MNYRTIYDISSEGYREWPYVILSLALFVFCAVLFVYLKRKRKSLVSFYVVSGFSILVALVSCGMTYWDYSRLRSALEQNRCQVAEGEVDNYWTREVEYYEGSRRRTRTYESFKVGGVQFGYYRELAAAGFTNRRNESFPIRDGLSLRIYYVSDQLLDSDGVDNRILRLEIKE